VFQKISENQRGRGGKNLFFFFLNQVIENNSPSQQHRQFSIQKTSVIVALRFDQFQDRFDIPEKLLEELRGQIRGVLVCLRPPSPLIKYRPLPPQFLGYRQVIIEKD
jgi:hypothetical protein